MITGKELMDLKNRISGVKDDITRSQAVMGEVKSNIDKEIQKLIDLGFDLAPILNSGGTDSEIHQKIINYVNEEIHKLEKNIEEESAAVTEIVNKWRD